MNRNAAKKIGKRGAGTWGRQGTQKEKRAASKAVRKEGIKEEVARALSLSNEEWELADNAGELDSINTLLGAWGDFIDSSEPAWHGAEWFDGFLEGYLNEK